MSTKGGRRVISDRIVRGRKHNRTKNMKTPKSVKSNGSIAFPEDFKLVKRNITSILNPELETCLFTFRGNEYSAESFSGIVFREMGWKDFDSSDKERIGLYWVDQVIHGVNNVLWSGYDHKPNHFGGSLNLFKPSFTYPTSLITPNGDVKVIYWFNDLKNNTVKQLQVIFDTNGDIKSRTILSSGQTQFYTGLSVFLGSTALAVGVFLLRAKITPLLRGISEYKN
ncbi:hypothetical protein RB653_006058 [Dictyostelium firmibasis]|uniref:Transmembrane protein n=1 Tax=Dictyostelium firmibasis TaxID=79012 RepID=A0AAN7U953_9MYCE